MYYMPSPSLDAIRACTVRKAHPKSSIITVGKSRDTLQVPNRTLHATRLDALDALAAHHYRRVRKALRYVAECKADRKGVLLARRAAAR